MKLELQNRLKNDFPYFEDGIVPNSPLATNGIECDDGWFMLLHSFFHCIGQQLKINVSPVMFLQIKEKYGMLTIYVKTSNNSIQGIIDAYSFMSMDVCEVCGTNTNVYCYKSKAGVFKCVCDVHKSPGAEIVNGYKQDLLKLVDPEQYCSNKKK